MLCVAALGCAADKESDAPFMGGQTAANADEDGDEGGASDGHDDGVTDGHDGDDADDGDDDGNDGNDGNDDGPPPAGECELEMDAAIRVTVNVTWDGGIAVLEGGGTINMWLLGKLDPTSGGLNLTGNLCRLELPDFETGAIAGGETYGTLFADAMWASPGIPGIDAFVELSSADPGATLHLDEGGVVLGADLGDPLNDPWPSEWSGLNAVDHDSDGLPGISSSAKVGGNYAYPRIDILNSDARAEALFVASRTILEFEGVVNDCDSAGGNVVMSMENHTVGCHVQGGGDCTSQQTTTLDNNLPVFAVQAGVFQLERLPTGSSCSEVFAALP